MTDQLARQYPAHLAALRRYADAALEHGKRDALGIPAGEPAYKFLDDLPYPFAVNPHFKWWLPVTDAPGSWLVYRPDTKPLLIYLQPRDYWHVVPEPPAGYWVEHFDIEIVHDRDEVRALLPKEPKHCAVLGDPAWASGDMVPDNPQAVVDWLHYHRAFKSGYEIECMRRANALGATAHRAAEFAFRSGESEFGIHMAYQHAAGLTESELPYGSIVALNRHGAVLHYSHFDRQPPSAADSFLIDAGAAYRGYASDITRSHAADDNGLFGELIDAMDEVQRRLCSQVRRDVDYGDLHIEAHRLIGAVLHDAKLIRMSGESAAECGLTRTFFPHGLGHGIGIQVHDVGGFQAGPEGGRIDQPEGHPFLRLTRKLEAGMVVTIEPGLYFIDLLLAELRKQPEAREVDWDRVESLGRFGGIRIEDDVVCTSDEPENLTRNAFAALD